MINVSDISAQFGSFLLFGGVSFTVRKNDRIGLIGRNGAGKSTLLKIIAGEDPPGEGSVTMPKDFTVGYLPQEVTINEGGAIFDEAKSALSEINELEKELKRLTDEIAGRDDYESDEYTTLVKKLSEGNERFAHLGGATAEAQIEKALTGLGFKQSDFSKNITEFSGGWQMRVELAKILLKRPDCILLDEPTNHLDIESIQWVENFLKNYEGSLILVSHDRIFLDSATNKTIEISLGKIYQHNAPYSEFIKWRESQKEQIEAAYKNQQRQIAQTERFIERFRYKNTLATRVQSRIKQLEKLDRIELEQEDSSSIKLNFPEPPRAGRVVAEAESLTKRYGDNLVLSKIEFAIERGDRIAFVGKNGEGKSTLSKILAGSEDYEGDLNTGYNVSVGYYAQRQAELLNENETVFEAIDNAATGEMRRQVRSLLGAFLFSGEDIDKKVKVLSGGEKSRLALAKLMLEPVNFLILDEPTNHLDMISKNALKNALLEFKGAIVLVSHDRDFLDSLTDKTFYFSNKKIKEYPGGIYEFLEKYNLEHLEELQEGKKRAARADGAKAGTAKIEREKRKALQRDEGKLAKKTERIEQEIEELEEKIATLESIFSSPDFYEQPGAADKQNEYESLKEALALALGQWEDSQLELEELRGKID